jgi:hypothetical protein
MKAITRISLVGLGGLTAGALVVFSGGLLA